MNSIIQQMRGRSTIRQEIRSEVSRRYAEKKEEKGWLRRFILWLKIERETTKELKRRFPPQALYLADSQR
jgi:hypothetical protein